MDAFFASVEQRNNPELRGKPIAVGYDGPRGVVSTASYEARRWGVHSAMSIQTAHRLCPELIVVEGDREEYKRVSQQVHEIFQSYTDEIEPLSIDEAFLDVTNNKKGIEMAVDIAREIRQRIADELHLTASAGISYCKFLAKVASDYRKPNGMTVIHPDKALDFIADLPIEKFWGIGSKTAARMHSMGIFTGYDLRKVSEAHLVEVFGKVGTIYHNFSLGIDVRKVETDSVRKSVGCERTFAEDIASRTILLIELYHAVLELVERIAKASFSGRTLTLKIKYADFRQITRSISVDSYLITKTDILPIAKSLLSQISVSPIMKVRLLGLSVSNPNGAETEGKWQEGLTFSFFDARSSSALYSVSTKTIPLLLRRRMRSYRRYRCAVGKEVYRYPLCTHGKIQTANSTKAAQKRSST